MIKKYCAVVVAGILTAVVLAFAVANHIYLAVLPGLIIGMVAVYTYHKHPAKYKFPGALCCYGAYASLVYSLVYTQTIQRIPFFQHSHMIKTVAISLLSASFVVLVHHFFQNRTKTYLVHRTGMTLVLVVLFAAITVLTAGTFGVVKAYQALSAPISFHR